MDKPNGHESARKISWKKTIGIGFLELVWQVDLPEMRQCGI
jgi:hypothetical protein